MAIAFLTSRKIIKLSGLDTEGFLQNIVTADLSSLSDERAAFAGLLSPQGKLLFDFFIYRKSDDYFIDCHASIAEELIKRLGFYRLRAKVEITDVSGDFGVFSAWGNQDKTLERAVSDPRSDLMGWRSIAPKNSEIDRSKNDQSIIDYDEHRIAIGIPNAVDDFAYGDVFPHDVCMDMLGGVDFSKGCYIGQEVVSRMQHRGTARTRVIKVRSASGQLTSKTDITADGKNVGKIGSVNQSEGVAIVRLDRAQRAIDEGLDLNADGLKISLEKPSWANYQWPLIQ